MVAPSGDDKLPILAESYNTMRWLNVPSYGDISALTQIIDRRKVGKISRWCVRFRQKAVSINSPFLTVSSCLDGNFGRQVRVNIVSIAGHSGQHPQ